MDQQTENGRHTGLENSMKINKRSEHNGVNLTITKWCSKKELLAFKIYEMEQFWWEMKSNVWPWEWVFKMGWGRNSQ